MTLQDIPIPDCILLHTMQSKKLYWEHIDQSTDQEADLVCYSDRAVWMDGKTDRFGKQIEGIHWSASIHGSMGSIFTASIAAGKKLDCEKPILLNWGN